jgi:hypothetical protein
MPVHVPRRGPRKRRWGLPEELYDKLKPFKERVAEDIKDGQTDR